MGVGDAVGVPIRIGGNSGNKGVISIFAIVGGGELQGFLEAGFGHVGASGKIKAGSDQDSN